MNAKMLPHLPANGLLSRSYWRAVTADIIGAIRQESPEAYLKRAWPTDDHARLVLRSTTTQATTTSSGWASDLTTWGVGPLPVLTPTSAVGRLSAACLPLEFQRSNSLIVPRVVTPPNASWIGEGSAHTMVQMVLGSIIAGPPRKLLFGCAITSELATYAPTTALAIIRSTLITAAVQAVDSALFDSVAADQTRPAGLLAGLSSLGASSSAGGALSALLADLQKLVGAASDAKLPTENYFLAVNADKPFRCEVCFLPLLHQVTTSSEVQPLPAARRLEL
jgi:hypothetical protein